jgi:RNA-directed DNA polymerase
MRAVRKHTDCAWVLLYIEWVLLYIERWLKAPEQMEDGSIIARERGTPQGGVISPLLANLFLHYTFDLWMRRNHPGIPFERYADDVICHCRSEEQARTLSASLERRFAKCGLTLHPEKTKIVYCKDDDRRGTYRDQKFDFLGYKFRPRLSRRRQGFGVVFSPAASNKALKTIRQTVRGWALHERSDKSLDDLARMFNANIRGWINYYGRYYKSALYPTLRHIDRIGSSEVQVLEAASTTITAMAGAHRAPPPRSVRSLADAAEQWEPDEARVSRPFLRERGGETPPRHSPRHPQSRSCG